MSGPSTPLRLRCTDIASRLGGPGAAAERDLLKADLATLYRSVDRELAELAALKEEVLALIESWKALPAPAAQRTAAEDTGAAARAPVRAAPRAAVEDAIATASAPPAGARPAVQADHLGASTFLEKGWHQISMGDAVGAERSLERALQLAPDEPQAEALLGWARMLQQRHDEALLLFQKVLQADPSNALARVNMGYICLKKGIFGEAIEHLSRVVRLDNDRKATLYAHFYLGLVYLERDMYEDAETFFRKTLALGPNLIEAYYELGRALWFGGDHEGARSTWRQGFAANKFSPWGKRCSELLETVDTGGAPLRSG
ncbi:MAG TPA: tetratricopeptide repeat protein [Gemmatimonadales bacterium]